MLRGALSVTDEGGEQLELAEPPNKTKLGQEEVGREGNIGRVH